MAFFKKLFGEGSSVRKKCSRNDYMNLSENEKKELTDGFLKHLKSKYSGKEFGYDSFPELDYDEMVLSTIFSDLKRTGHITGAGYMVFKIK
jgi:hypothetical protein